MKAAGQSTVANVHARPKSPPRLSLSDLVWHDPAQLPQRTLHQKTLRVRLLLWTNKSTRSLCEIRSRRGTLLLRFQEAELHQQALRLRRSTALVVLFSSGPRRPCFTRTLCEFRFRRDTPTSQSQEAERQQQTLHPVTTTVPPIEQLTMK